MKKQHLTERFQQLAGIKPLYEDTTPSDVESDIEDALKSLTTDISNTDIKSNSQDEALGVLTLAGITLSGGEIVKIVGKFINLLSKIPFLKKLSGDKLIKIGDKYHHVVVGAIEKIVIAAGVKDKQKAHKFAEAIHMLVVAGLLFAGLGNMAAKFSTGNLSNATFKAALNAVKSGELTQFIRKVASSI